jgi:predicted GIY-YIG superfamily endonuclease
VPLTDPSSETAVYRLYDRDRNLLYVGIAYVPAERWAQHALDKPWWSQVSRKTVQ